MMLFRLIAWGENAGNMARWAAALCLLALLLVVSMPVRAQQQQTAPANPPTAAVDAGQTDGYGIAQPYIRSPKERYRLFVFGDKMATGLLAGLWRVLENNPRFVARGRFNAGSGLVRLRYYDWQRAIAQVLDSRPVDIGVVMLGVNDVRDIVAGGRRIPFGSEEWKRIYATRLDAIIETFRNAGVALYLVGLPPVREARLDAGVRLVDELIRQRARASGVRYIGIRKHFAGPDGGFVENGADINGAITRLRARNGVHFIKAGNTVLAKLVMDVIGKDVERAVALPAPQAMGVGGADAGGSDKPFVGRAGPGGEPVYESPASLPGTDTVYLARTPSSAEVAAHDTLEMLRRSTAADSPAGNLFRQGLWAAAAPGWVDDFSAPLEELGDKAGQTGQAIQAGKAGQNGQAGQAGQ